MALAFVVFAGLPHASAAKTPLPPEGVLNFWVVRDGSLIGTHVMKFKENGAKIDVDILTDVKVKLAFVTVYKFWHEGREQWQDGQLVGLQSKTDDDGIPHDLTVVRLGDRFKSTDKGKAVFDSDASILPASLWHPGIVKPSKTSVLNTLDGTEMAIQTVLAGEEQVKGTKGPVMAKHYVISGQLKRELWFDPDGVLVKVRFKGKDGSDIQYVLR
ncbi:MAG: hypothetical protein HQL45_13285 [Alphaproteobacteria bacterium]|nr:hypothetical protein [Alphaproteobacteria bacterium]